MTRTLIMVYNNDSGLYRKLAKKSEQRKCNLYKLTHGKLLMEKSWKRFLDSLVYHKVFYHRDEFKKNHQQYSTIELPVIMLKDGDAISTLMSTAEINSITDVDDLVGLLAKKLSGI